MTVNAEVSVVNAIENVFSILNKTTHKFCSYVLRIACNSHTNK